MRDPSVDGEELKARFLLNETMEEYRTRLAAACRSLRAAWESGQRYGFVVIAEAFRKLAPEARWLEVAVGFIEAEVAKWGGPRKPDVRMQELGYPVRGVPPGRFDLWLGAALGHAAVKCLVEGRTERMVGWTADTGIQEVDFASVVSGSRMTPAEKWVARPEWKRSFAVHSLLASRPW
jgi:6-phosphofructokinase